MKMYSPRTLAFIALAFGFLCSPLLVCSCAQENKSPINTSAEERTVTPAATTQEQGTMGSKVYVYIINAPHAPGLPDDATMGLTETQPAHATAVQPGGATSTNAGFTQAGFTLNIQTGGTTPSVTGTSTATGSGQQTQTANPSVAPVQKVEPVIDVPIAFGMPGSAPSAQGSAGGRGSTTTGQNQSPTNNIRWASVLQTLASCGADTQQTALSWLESFLNGGQAAQATPGSVATPAATTQKSQ